MLLTEAAKKHGIPDEDILHAWENAIRYRLQDYHSETQIIAAGPARDGTLLELIAVEADSPNRIIHCMKLRESTRRLLLR